MKMSTKTMVTAAMFTAVLSVLSIISIPMPTGVPITLQTFAVALCGYVLGSGRGTAATALYILIGTVGIPVFAGMTGGPSWLIGYTGGFIWGFLFMSFFCGIAAKGNYSIAVKAALGVAGLAICHILGAVQFAIVANVSLLTSFVMVSIPYIVKDLLSVVGACIVSLPLRRVLYAGGLLHDETGAAARV